MSELDIRDGQPHDVEALRAIYNEVVANSTAIFSDVPRSSAEHMQWFNDRRAQGWPVIVACRDGEVIGNASYGPFRARPGNRLTEENSIYLTPHARGRGFGVQLLNALIDRARSQGLHAVIAGIDGDNTPSMRLHEKAGFTKVGHLKQVASKFGRWLDLVFYERLL